MDKQRDESDGNRERQRMQRNGHERPALARRTRRLQQPRDQGAVQTRGNQHGGHQHAEPCRSAGARSIRCQQHARRDQENQDARQIPQSDADALGARAQCRVDASDATFAGVQASQEACDKDTDANLDEGGAKRAYAGGRSVNASQPPSKRDGNGRAGETGQHGAHEYPRRRHVAGAWCLLTGTPPTAMQRRERRDGCEDHHQDPTGPTRRDGHRSLEGPAPARPPLRGRQGNQSVDGGRQVRISDSWIIAHPRLTCAEKSLHLLDVGQEGGLPGLHLDQAAQVLIGIVQQRLKDTQSCLEQPGLPPGRPRPDRRRVVPVASTRSVYFHPASRARAASFP